MPDAGRGVFARIAIKKGELIERCPVIPIPSHDVSALSHSILLTYFYFFGKKKERMVVALGFGSIYNHTYTPNASYKEQEKEQAIDFIAIKDIQKDEEITVNYVQGKKKNKNPLWFPTAKPE
ncbi:MAG TPA: SET domain-containing protein-lysine N-methyltransferase [Candidatus Acidoferrales bacterium]|nr:SET domain-containing protein-lysine N-methyltransferase [Candidatus Acidoferrales bacterium]